jgi:porphobilinogen synthase
MHAGLRELTAEVRLSPKQFIQPHFVVEGLTEPEPVPGLNDVFRDNEDSLLKRVEADLKNGTSKILLFGVPQHKAQRDFDFSFTSRQIERLRANFGDALMIAVDVCLCSYTEHGHCGVLDQAERQVHNQQSVGILAQAARTYAAAGADCVAPSDMMDGRVAAVRQTLDANDLGHVALMSYSAKFHSRFYGPFRLAAESAPSGAGPKDRASYQIDPARPKDALRASLRDAEEGADILMVKPGLPYLDVLQTLAAQTQLPIAVYQTSGEYAGIELAAAANLMDGPAAHVEAWTAFARAGAQIIISYGARHAASYLATP